MVEITDEEHDELVAYIGEVLDKIKKSIISHRELNDSLKQAEEDIIFLRKLVSVLLDNGAEVDEDTRQQLYALDRRRLTAYMRKKFNNNNLVPVGIIRSDRDG